MHPTGPLPSQPTESSGSNAVAHKVHITGVDDLTTTDLKAFVAEHYPTEAPPRFEWVDDSSANIVYQTPAVALKALESFSAHHLLQPLELRSAKCLSIRPESRLRVRMALSTDVKRPRAHEASRFYMMHPEHDPREKGRGRNRMEGSSDYQARRYGDGEHRRRRLQDRESAYSASMYDDDSGNFPQKGHASRQSSTSMKSNLSSLADERTDRRRPSQTGQVGGDYYRPGTGSQRALRHNRSASPRRDNETYGTFGGRGGRQRTPPVEYRKELFPVKSASVASGKELFPNKTVAANLKRELFPVKSSSSHHRRSDAFDAADETADLFAARMAFSERSPAVHKIATTTTTDPSYGRLRSSDMEPRDDSGDHVEDTGISIRGASKHQESGVSIRGAAGASQAEAIRELFPAKLGNVGRELFAEKVQGRGRRRNKAEDMFY